MSQELQTIAPPPDSVRVILGIDPGYDRCGWGVIAAKGKRIKTLDYGCIQTKSSDDKATRFAQLWSTLDGIFEHFPISEVAMESLYFSRNVSTALPVSEVRGMIFAHCLQREISWEEYTPAAIKLAVTGYGKAPKQQMGQMITKLLELEKIPNIDDTGDALATAYTHAVTNDWTLG